MGSGNKRLDVGFLPRTFGDILCGELLAVPFHLSAKSRNRAPLQSARRTVIIVKERKQKCPKGLTRSHLSQTNTKERLDAKQAEHSTATNYQRLWERDEGTMIVEGEGVSRGHANKHVRG